MSTGWSRVSAKVNGLMAVTAVVISGAVILAVLPFLVCEETAEAGEEVQARQTRADMARVERELIRQEQEEWDRQFDARMAGLARAAEERRVEHEASPEQQTKRPARNVRRWNWEAPAETRSRLWNVPVDETEETVITGLLRICTAEQEASEEDCRGIWQVINNIRIRSCDRQMIRRITECDEAGETLLSVMRRAQRFALGVVPPRSRRSRWISEMTTECNQPESYPESLAIWDRRHRRHCERTVTLARGLVSGEDTDRITGARVIAWGGRCEDPRGACDDPIACSRGLVRVRGLETHNAFWRRSRGPDDIEPICAEMLGERQAFREIEQSGTPEG